MNWIEEVRKILCRKIMVVHQGVPIDVYLPDNLVIELGDKICQLFPQPITDEELEKKLSELRLEVYGAQLTENDIAQILTLLQQRVEEAKRQERERIANWGIEICHEHLPKWMGRVDLLGGVSSRRECPRCWQALSGDKKETDSARPKGVAAEQG